MPPTRRVQANLIASRERLVLDWICTRLPPWITPDHLTAIGILGAFAVFAGYCASGVNPAFLWLATFGFVLHWLGDSLDGSLARHRGCERPSYGYFLDHSVDAFCNLIILIGLGISPFVRMDVALFVLCGYYMLCMFVFLHNHVTGIFKLSFLALGPTELRLGLIAINTTAFFWEELGSDIEGLYMTLYDCILIVTGIVFVTIFIYQMCLVILQLRAIDRPQRVHSELKFGPSMQRAQMADTKASIFSK
jgi:archaetidylinositol phosphate synthase